MFSSANIAPTSKDVVKLEYAMDQKDTDHSPLISSTRIGSWKPKGGKAGLVFNHINKRNNEDMKVMNTTVSEEMASNESALVENAKERLSYAKERLENTRERLDHAKKRLVLTKKRLDLTKSENRMREEYIEHFPNILEGLNRLGRGNFIVTQLKLDLLKGTEQRAVEEEAYNVAFDYYYRVSKTYDQHLQECRYRLKAMSKAPTPRSHLRKFIEDQPEPATKRSCTRTSQRQNSNIEIKQEFD